MLNKLKKRVDSTLFFNLSVRTKTELITGTEKYEHF